MTSYDNAWVQPGYNLGIVWAAKLGCNPRFQPPTLFCGWREGYYQSFRVVADSNSIQLESWFMFATSALRTKFFSKKRICNETQSNETACRLPLAFLLDFLSHPDNGSSSPPKRRWPPQHCMALNFKLHEGLMDQKGCLPTGDPYLYSLYKVVCTSVKRRRVT